ncbi:hypothetical protein N0V90_000237 [Kalmusia sp. IMI 367209]|nr:hypothetical protein N0V90_000237 [Kalmusia sp. IMI 367209]
MPGRGGAGNIIQAQEQSKRAVEVSKHSLLYLLQGCDRDMTFRMRQSHIALLYLIPSNHSHPEQDVEAAHTLSTPANPTTTNPSQPYAHTGRGGAGNWYAPSQLEKEGTFTTPSDATALPTTSKPQVSKPWHPEGQQMPVARAGRGGAGNFVWGDGEEEKRKREAEVRKEEEVSEGVERDVEAGLAKPGPAVLGGVKAGRGW